jgi:triosephosphate isomerase
MRRPIIAGNWKMNLGPSSAAALARDIVSGVSKMNHVDIVLAPTFVSLSSVAAEVRGSKVGLSGQNLHWEEGGAYTGEIPAPMLVEVGCRYAIIGHSERRQLFGETDENVNFKIKAALAHNLTPIVCVGETLDEREAGRTMERVEIQIGGAFAGLRQDDLRRVVLAYEPIWAIGTGRTATPQQAQEVHGFIREKLASRFTDAVAQDIRIQYGGSVKPGNAGELMGQADIDGALVGGASLNAESFVAIIDATSG